MSDLNVQTQLDTHFLILESPGRLAGAINEATRLDQIDGLVQNLSSKIRKAEAGVGTLKDEQAVVDERLGNPLFEMLDDFETLLTLAQSLEKGRQRRESEMFSMERSISVLERVDLDLAEARKVLKVKDKFETLFQNAQRLFDRMVVRSVEREALRLLIINVQTLEQNLCVQRVLLLKREKELLILSKQRDRGGLEGLVSSLETIEEKLSRQKALLVLKQQEFGGLLKELEDCPLCGSEFESDEVKAQAVRVLSGK